VDATLHVLFTPTLKYLQYQTLLFMNTVLNGIFILAGRSPQQCGNENVSKQQPSLVNNGSAGVLYILVHVFAILCKTTMLNGQIQSFKENVNAQ